MINLKDVSGLDIGLLEDNKLFFGEGISNDKFSTRNFVDLAPVTADKKLDLPDAPAYLMYRNVRKDGDLEKINQAKVRFDLTIIPPAMLGHEYIKTSGHYHPKKPTTNISYPELYYVISGQATYLMQKSENGQITDFIICRVLPGQAIVTPPEYGHVTVNELSEPLVMANWVGDQFQSEYGEYETKRGGAYYDIKNALGQPKFEKNPNYQNLPKERELITKPQILSAVESKPIYDYSSNIEILNFLDIPENFRDDLQVDKLFEEKEKK